MTKKYFLIYIILVLISEALFISIVYRIHKNELQEIEKISNEHYRVKLESSIYNLNLVSLTIFTQMINNEKVLNLISKANNNDTLVQKKIRDSLYKLMKPTYDFLNSVNIKQLHFQLPNNVSFLRMHRPEKYGDDLTNVRYSIRMTNETKKPHYGFEEGRIYNGFRYVFPLFYRGNHIGSVETSFSFEAIRDQFKKLGSEIVAMILKKDVVLGTVFADEQKNYEKTYLSNDYLVESKFSHYSYYSSDTAKLLKKIDSLLSKQIVDKIHREHNFSKFIEINNEHFLVNFLSLKNLENKHVGYIIVYSKNSIISSIIKKNKRILLAGTTFIPFLIILLTLFLKNEEKIRKQNNELKIINEELKIKNDELLTAEEELRQQNEQLITLNTALEKHKEELEKINKELNNTLNQLNIANQKIQSNINYAANIQKALLTTDQIINKYLEKYFLIFKPKDVISGDFYYINKIDTTLIIAIADCTGHGVAGAFISIIGITYLHDTVTTKQADNPKDVLSILRERFKRTFRTFGTESLEGMDIALCFINVNTKILKYAGAYLSCWIAREGNLVEIKGTPTPIGIYPQEKSFELSEFQLQKNDIIYIFTDGIYEQINDDKRKMTKKIFVDKLKEISTNDFESQASLINNFYDLWKNNSPQIDDVTIFGMKIS